MSREEMLSKLIFEMGMPTFVTQLVNVLYNIVDRIHIGHIENVGINTLTGVDLTFPIIILISTFSNLLGADSYVMSIYWAEPISDAASAILRSILFFTSFKGILNKREKQLTELKNKKLHVIKHGAFY